MYDVGSKFFNGIKGTYINSVASVRVIETESGIIHGWVMFLWLFIYG